MSDLLCLREIGLALLKVNPHVLTVTIWTDKRDGYLPALHFSEQYFTFSQSRAHFLRHSKGRLQRWQILGGKPFLVLACIGRGYSELPWKIFFSRFKNLVEFAKLFLIERTPRK